MGRLLLLTPIILLILNAEHAQGSVVLPVSLEQLTGEAGVVFAGTVRSVESYRDPAVGILSRITFRQVEIVKSPHRFTTDIILTVAGGRVGDTGVSVVGIPTFIVGSRYVLFCDQSLGSASNDYVPFLGLFQGIYHVTSGKEGHGDILDGLGRPLVGVVEGRPVVVVDEPQYAKTHPSTVRIISAEEQGRDIDPKITPGGKIVSARQNALPPDAPPDSIAETARRMGAKYFDGFVYIVPKSRDTGHRLMEAEFLNEIKRLMQR